MSTIHVDRGIADSVLKSAIAYCANQHTAGDNQLALQSIRSGVFDVCECLRNNLVDQIAQVLGELDKTVIAVFTYNRYDPTNHIRINDGPPEDIGTSINLVLWVERKSAALISLAGSLEKDLRESQQQYGCLIRGKDCINLFIELVDDFDVKEKLGFGFLVSNSHLKTRQVWKRSETGREEQVSEKEKGEQVEIKLPHYFDPQIMPVDRLIAHASGIENMPPDERKPLEPHLTELKVILIKRLISDQLAYIDIAKNWFTVADLEEILQRRIGEGRIGGKAAGMLLAAKIIETAAEDEVRSRVRIPVSYYLGSDLIYIFMAMNGLIHWNDQKYKPEDQIKNEYSQIQEEFQHGSLPPEITNQLEDILADIGPHPLIVRSSSQLEDNFGTSFAGKYDSFFCPNQGSPEENLNSLCSAIKKTYASTLKPDALLYRRSKGLQDYDERMAVMIQVVQGEKFKKYLLPQAAGFAFSKNLYRWSPQINKDDGFIRLVWGLGTRAVQRVGDDYPRLVALSHPTLQPDDSVEAVRRYSQKFVDLIDLQENKIVSLPVHDVLSPRYPPLRMIAQVEQEGFFTSPRMRIGNRDIQNTAITFQEFLKRTPFARCMRKILHILEEHYHGSVDLEFTASIPDPRSIQPEIDIALLQCRPQSYLVSTDEIPDIDEVPQDAIIFRSQFMVPRGYTPDIKHIIYISSEGYFNLESEALRFEVGKIISQLNSLLGRKTFVCIGPGRWGSMNLDLGVFVSYADIDNAGALIELSGSGIGPAPEPSLGTHFFQDLMEAKIYPLAIDIDREDVIFDWEYFNHSPNSLSDYIPGIEKRLSDCVRLINVTSTRPGHHFEIRSGSCQQI